MGKPVLTGPPIHTPPMSPLSRFFLGIAFLGSSAFPLSAEVLLALSKGDHVAIVGSGLADRQQHHGWLEALIHRAYPDYDLTVRNLGFAADEINVQPRSDEAPGTGYFLSMRKGETLAKRGNTEVVYQAGTDFGADVILAYWGFNESFRGQAGIDGFKRDLEHYLDAQLDARYNGESAPRVVLFSPIAHEDLDHPDFPDGASNNHNLALYTEAMREVATSKGVPFVDLYAASRILYEQHEQPLTINGIHLNDEGDRLLAPVQFEALFGEKPAPADARLAALREAILEKNTEWHHRYRTVDQYNIYGGRSRISYEGVTNAVILGQEMAQRDVKTANRDRRVWAIAKGGDLQVADDNLPPVAETPPNRPEPIPYLSGEEAIKHLILPENCKVELVASEETYPELVNPVQMAFDTRGRLWVAAWPNYPETAPTTKVFDKLLVIDLDPQTGKASQITTFLDGLNCPTGFQFYKDGVLLIQSPDLWYVRDTDGDGKADWKERVLHGLDAADSHHETNSMCLEPGGAVYLSDGVFHRSNVETINGPIRNRDGAIYRFEPNTYQFTRHVPYGFANPHGRVFDRWGNDLITDATGNDNYFGPAFSGHLDSGSHAGMKTFWGRPSRPCAGTAILSSRHFPDEWQGQFLNANVIGIQGILRAQLSEDGSGIKGETLEHLVATDVSKNPNFRPSGVTVAPDGSLYFMDWSQMLIGHLQHHLRDPNRDHQHGRIYRITYEGRPLLVPKVIHDQPIPALLELLKEPENDVRMRAKIELGRHPANEVVDAVRGWLARLDSNDSDHEHHVLEALWVHQWHNIVNLDLLERVLKSPDPRARAQAVRVLGYWRERVPNALAIVKAAATDEAPRVRLEAVRVASFFRQWEAADAALAALAHPPDYYIEYCLGETMRQLETWWKPALREGAPLAASNPAGVRFILGGVSTADLAKLPPSATVYTALLTRDDASAADRQLALSALAKADGISPAAALLSVLKPLAGNGGQTAEALGNLLLLQSPADLKNQRSAIVELAAAPTATQVRRKAIAALLLADGSLEPTWESAGKSASTLGDWLAALPQVPDPALRAAAFARVHSLATALPPEISEKLGKTKGPVGRYLRISLPRRGTLTLAEVEIFSHGVQVARTGRARQSSVSHGGAAERAIDGRTDGSYASGTQTHTVEGEDHPWWEVDLGEELPLESVTIWNRSENNGAFAGRLEGFELIVMDSSRSEVFRKSNNPAPAVSATIQLDHDPAGELRQLAVEAMVAAGGPAASVSATLAELILKQELVPAATRGLRRLPRESWSVANAAEVVNAIIGWADGIPASARTAQDFIETMQFAQDLASQLPADRASQAIKTIRGLGISTHVVRAVREELRFDVSRLVVEAGKPFEVIFENPDLMPHNLLIVAPGSRQQVSEAVQADPPTTLDSQGRAYVPERDRRVIAATKLLEAGQKETLRLTAPTEEGEYEFVCTFPGHWTLMWGRLIVTKDVEAYLASHPLAD
jgi:azurin/glucose/arabinose dehydrogenase